jgi:hypothetical protein
MANGLANGFCDVCPDDALDPEALDAGGSEKDGKAAGAGVAVDPDDDGAGCTGCRAALHHVDGVFVFHAIRLDCGFVLEDSSLVN